MDKLKDFIYIKEDALSKDFCNHCIEKFENDDRKCIGVFNNGTSGVAVVDKTVKQSTDLYISSESDWNEESLTFDKSLSEHYESYVNKIFSEEYRNDSYRDRLVTFIWYLNDIIEDGYTEFEFGLKVQPRVGKILLFPATWQYLHRGYPPKSETKYLCTGWLYFAS